MKYNTANCVGYRPSLGWTPPPVKAGTPGNGCMGIDNAHNTEQLLSSNATNLHDWYHMINWGLYGIPQELGNTIWNTTAAIFLTISALVITTQFRNDHKNN